MFQLFVSLENIPYKFLPQRVTNIIDLDKLLENLDCRDDLASPSDDFDRKKFLNSLRVAKNENRPLVDDINAAIDILMSTDGFEGFLNVFKSSVEPYI